MRVVAILETMWGAEIEGVEAPRFFQINRNNHSGRRLYQLIGPGNSLVVTNACREYVKNAKQHGKPDPKWLGENLALLDATGRIEVVLVCGKVAQATYSKCGYTPKNAKVIAMPHPAARFAWNKELVDRLRREICKEGI